MKPRSIQHWFDGKLTDGLPPLANVRLNLAASEQAKLDRFKDEDTETIEAVLAVIKAMKKSG